MSSSTSSWPRYATHPSAPENGSPFSHAARSPSGTASVCASITKVRSPPRPTCSMTLSLSGATFCTSTAEPCDLAAACTRPTIDVLSVARPSDSDGLGLCTRRRSSAIPSSARSSTASMIARSSRNRLSVLLGVVPVLPVAHMGRVLRLLAPLHVEKCLHELAAENFGQGVVLLERFERAVERPGRSPDAPRGQVGRGPARDVLVESLAWVELATDAVEARREQGGRDEERVAGAVCRAEFDASTVTAARHKAHQRRAVVASPDRVGGRPETGLHAFVRVDRWAADRDQRPGVRDHPTDEVTTGGGKLVPAEECVLG